MTDDFETHPIGTAAEIERLKAQVDAGYNTGWNDGYAARDSEGWLTQAEIEARVLEQLADSMGKYLPKGSIRGWVRSEANRIRRQANETPKRQTKP